MGACACGKESKVAKKNAKPTNAVLEVKMAKSKEMNTNNMLGHDSSSDKEESNADNQIIREDDIKLREQSLFKKNTSPKFRDLGSNAPNSNRRLTNMGGVTTNDIKDDSILSLLREESSHPKVGVEKSGNLKTRRIPLYKISKFCISNSQDYSTEVDFNTILKTKKITSKSVLSLKLLTLKERRWVTELIQNSEVTNLFL